MSEIHGFAVDAAGAHLLPYNFSPEELQANEVEIKISHCGIRHSDVHRIDSDRGFSKYPFIPGHEVVGTVIAVGPSVREHLCAQSQPTCPGGNGGHADKIRVNFRFAIPLPDALESEATAPLLWAGVTLQNHGVKPSSPVGNWDWRTRPPWNSVRESVWRRSHSLFDRVGKRGRGEEPWSTPLREHPGHRCTEEGGRVLRFSVVNGEPRPGRAGVDQRCAAKGNTLRYRHNNLCPANSALFFDRRTENGVWKPDRKPPRFLRDGGRPCPKQYQSTSEPFG